MAAYDYSKLQATATRLFARFGRAATLVKLTPGSGYNPGDPAEVPAPVTIVATNYSQRERDGTLVEMTDQKFYVDSSVTPESQDVIEDGNNRFVIINAMAIRPGPDAVLYELQVRTG